MEPYYIIRAALQEETNSGWVWICRSTAQRLELESRMVVKIRRPNHGCRSVYTEVRKIDHNFRVRYNCDPTGLRRKICKNCKNQGTIVMSEWYRLALGIERTTGEDNLTDTVPLIVEKARGLFGSKSLRVACHHPDPVVRLGSRLGVLGVWLGLLALEDPLMNVAEHFNRLQSPMTSPVAWIGVTGSVVMVILALLGIWACWGRPRPLGR